MRRISSNDIIDAEFRVIPASRLDAWKIQLPSTQERIGFVLAAIAGAAVIGGVLTGHLFGGFIAGLMLVGIAAMLTEQHKPLGLASLGLAVMLATTGCSKDPAPLAADHTEKSQDEVQASIREATKYHDPRAGFKPKPIVVGGAAQEPAKEKGNDSR
ncbi:hypothetical protein [Xanthomonas euvesicatoria]|nr:hypothetical protein [Xanthomonas euvesicatoria]KLA49990.1 hypothetical protein XEUV685_21890 [Xanthomonas euvesicatoria]KLA54500.1 hypothetical protein XEUV684_19140 [Xanthomonas euvesicatoria]KLA54996.1 hypothetical protein XEUV683_05755 [Xanthomonas euvesicatoria]KLA62849.1 hypothetical protein XEUV695_21760 [Xanthomonas euvesicatoria]KLA63769.1 hypothetical protein XEUV689_19560 [Xanthomonas euvesicatoria]